ncbi:hypothetical protein GCM10009801_07470 [Streptomyces albiaxialis]|uniref:Integral membrane protein n=2 Tax=Streptomyces albiaxialis TaxID=329523 RepID=A0ABN2VL28_9ACTN
MPAPVRRGLAALTGPVLVGLVYGLWALAIQRKGEPATGGEILLSVVAGVVVAVVFHVLRHQARRLQDETRAAAWGVSAGIAVGFLHSLVNTSVLWSGTLGFFVALGVIPLAYYRFAEVEK